MVSHRYSLRITALTLVVTMASIAASEAQEFRDSDYEFFESKVRPLLVEKCFECHGPDSGIEGGLSVASRTSVVSGGDTGPGMVPGDAANSLIIDVINYGDVYQMPPDTKMSSEEIAVLTKWVNLGAPWPRDSEVHVEAREKLDISKRKAEHWCWQPIKNPKIPKVANKDWPLDPIDNFVLARLEQAKLSPAQPTDKRTLIRRVFFDLIGLPPTPEEVTAFLDDVSPDAYERVVDQLLSRPEFGERWARHWMDLTRYAETCGHEFDYPIKHAYQYRDYLIRAFNNDVPYNQFVEEHIAGDLLPNPRRNPDEQFNESIIGTGFWFLGEATHGPVDVRGDEAGHIDNRIDVMSKTFLGLTVACARCHDHKFDAISTKDYYALAGFLQSSRRQLAMLDPASKIKMAHEQASRLATEGEKLLQQIAIRLGQPDQEQLGSYVDAAIQVLRSDAGWAGDQAVRFQGEDLREIERTGGENRIQDLTTRGKFSWEGNQQLWWIDAKIDDVLKLEFSLPPNDEPIEWEFEADFTKAVDYGIASVSVDGETVKDRIDFFHRSVVKTGPMKLGRVSLTGGNHTLEFKIIGHHKQAVPRHMLGLDWIELRPVAPRPTNQLEEIAAKHGVDADVLERLLQATIGEKASSANVLSCLKLVSPQESGDDHSVLSQVKKKLAEAESRQQEWQKDSERFEDFADGLPAGWFATGFAFENVSGEVFSASGPVNRLPGTVHSGLVGSKFCGVIRSPTFELNHDRIHYRVRGKNVTIRLIIDGYVMDVFNALLYKGCTIEVGEAKNFEWHTQASDIRNYKGHRAHLEIIDHGDGFFELDEIRFSNNAKPPVHTWADSRVSGVVQEANSSQIPASGFRDWLVNQLMAGLQARESDLISWIIENQLETVVVGDDQDALNASVDPGHSRNQARVDFVSIDSGNLDTKIDAARIPVARLREKLLANLGKLSAINEKTPLPRFAIAMTDGTGEDERVFIRGNHKTLGEVVVRRFLSAISAKELNPEQGSGRLQLARKITAPNNPLTSRVAVNRVWHHLMGAGIVESVDNFGVLGKPPTHPQLLDHLATTFQQKRWSMKGLIRRIVLTQTYRMSSTVNPAASTIDPDNRLIHRARIKRLQGEAIRDSILQISGEIDKTMFGPSVPIHLTPFMSGRGRPGKSGPLDGEGRRSIYITVRRNFLSPMMLAFDTPIPFNTIGRRNQSNVPAQALILMNDPFVVDQSSKWAQRLMQEVPDVDSRIEQVYLQALGRPPTPTEKATAQEFLSEQANDLGVAGEEIVDDTRIWQDLCHVMFNLKEFIFIK